MITELEVDGVPALLAPADGPMHAGLVFRVGFADETLARHGLTHLIEHLVMHAMGLADQHRNAATGAEHTYFHMQGSPTDIADFLAGVCATLRDLPMDRLAAEKEILRTEAAGRGGEPLAAWRYGARDYGLCGYPESGLHALTPDDLVAWVAHYFTKENAALWVAGDAVPDGLKLDLPTGGVRRAAPTASSALPVTPAWFPGPSPTVVWDTVVRREARAAVFGNVLRRRMFHELRQVDGLSYTVRTDYEPRADGMAVLTAVADALPEKQEAVLGGFLDVLAGLRAGRIEADEVSTVIEQTGEALREAEASGGRLLGQTFNVLAGRGVQDLADAVAEVRAVTLADVAEVAVAAHDGGLLMTPPGNGAGWAGYAAAPTASDNVVTGTAYRVRSAGRSRLIVGAEGVTAIGRGQLATVRHDACAAYLVWPDGGRQLIGHDGVVVAVEPTLIKGAELAIRDIDARIPASLRVDLPRRDPSRKPQPRRSGPGWLPAVDPRRWLLIGQVALLPGLLTLFFGWLALTGLSWVITKPETAIRGAAAFLICGAIAGLAGRRTWRSAQRFRSG
jgi:zinc protease